MSRQGFDDDLWEAQQRFLAESERGARPAARVVRVAKKKEKETPTASSDAAVELIGGIVERTVPTSAMAFAKPPETKLQSKFAQSVHNKGFPVATRRVTNDSGVTRAEPADPSKAENDDRIKSMSRDEIQQAVAELEASLPAELVRIVRSKSKKGKDLQSGSNPRDTEDEKLNWTKDVTQAVESEKKMIEGVLEHEKPLGPAARYRFDLDGNFLSDEQTKTIPCTKGLHHHGVEPELAGYTVTELILLCRSTYIRQRVIAMNTLTAIMSKGKLNENHAAVDVILAAADGVEALVGALEGHVENKGLVAAWTYCVHSYFYDKATEEDRDLVLRSAGYSTRVALSQGSEKVMRGFRANLLNYIDSALRASCNLVDKLLEIILPFASEAQIAPTIATSNRRLIQQLWIHASSGEPYGIISLRALTRIVCYPGVDTSGSLYVDASRVVASQLDASQSSPRLTGWHLCFWRFALDNNNSMFEEFDLALSSICGMLYASLQKPNFELAAEIFLALESFVEFMVRNDWQSPTDGCLQLRPVAERATQFIRSVLSRRKLWRSERSEDQIHAAAHAYNFVTTLRSVLGTSLADFGTFTVAAVSTDVESLADLILAEVKDQSNDIQQVRILSLLLAMARSASSEYETQPNLSRGRFTKIIPRLTAKLTNSTRHILEHYPKATNSFQFKLLVDTLSEWTLLEEMCTEIGGGCVERIMVYLIPYSTEQDLIILLLKRGVLAVNVLSRHLGLPRDRCGRLASALELPLTNLALAKLQGKGKDRYSSFWALPELFENCFAADIVVAFAAFSRGLAMHGIVEPGIAWRFNLELLLVGHSEIEEVSSEISVSLEVLGKATLASETVLVPPNTEMNYQVRLKDTEDSPRNVSDTVKFGMVLNGLVDKFVDHAHIDRADVGLMASSILACMVVRTNPSEVRVAMWRRLVIESGVTNGFVQAVLLPPMSAYVGEKPDSDAFLNSIYRSSLVSRRLSRQRGRFLYILAVLSVSHALFGRNGSLEIQELDDSCIADIVVSRWPVKAPCCRGPVTFEEAANLLWESCRVETMSVAEKRIEQITPQLGEARCVALRRLVAASI